MKKSMFKLAAAERVLVCVMLFFSGNLLFAQSSLSAKDNDLFEAAKSGTVADIKAALKNGANINAKDEDGSTVLMYAASDNTNPDVIKALIAAGANVNARDEDGWTALMSATEWNTNPDVIKALINAGADVNARDEDGWTALMSAAAADNSNPDVIKALIAAGADVNARDEDRWTALMSAAFWNTNPDVIKALINAGANVNARDRKGKRAIDHLESNEKISKTDDAYWTIRDLLY